MLHTIQEAIALTGRSRRKIYNHCDQGRVSYGLCADGRRYFDTAELIRAYGPLQIDAQPAPSKIAQSCTPSFAHKGDGLTESTARRLVADMERLIELEERRLLLIEHKPEALAEPEHWSAGLLDGLRGRTR